MSHFEERFWLPSSCQHASFLQWSTNYIVCTLLLSFITQYLHFKRYNLCLHNKLYLKIYTFYLMIYNFYLIISYKFIIVNLIILNYMHKKYPRQRAGNVDSIYIYSRCLNIIPVHFKHIKRQMTKHGQAIQDKTIIIGFAT